MSEKGHGVGGPWTVVGGLSYMNHLYIFAIEKKVPRKSVQPAMQY
jgi:hypothetical protein